MTKNKLTQTLATFSKKEQTAFKKMLRSPFFNRRDDLARLGEHLLADGNLEADKETAFAARFPGQPFDLPKLRLSMTDLQKLAEQFLVLQHHETTPWQTQKNLLAVYRKRGLNEHFKTTIRQVEQQLESQPLRNVLYFSELSQIRWEASRLQSAHDPEDTHLLESASRAADIVWLAQKLRHLCLMKTRQTMIRAEPGRAFGLEALRLAEQYDLTGEPVVGVWFHCWHMQESPDAEPHFRKFKTILLANGRCFDEEELRDLYLFAINFCIRGVNAGERRFFHDIMDFYKTGLAEGYLFENGVLSRFTYHNIVAAGLQTQEYEWVENFIRAYKNTLERSFRDSSFSFNMARLAFSRRQYDQALGLLQHSNYYDPLLNLAARTMTLKIFFETGETDLLESQLDALQNYIRRKSILGYHRTNYQNLVKYTRKLLTVNPLDKKELEKVRKKISEEPILTEREWVLEQLDLLMSPSEKSK